MKRRNTMLKADVEDYAEIEEATQAKSGSRVMSWVVIGVAVGGFIGLAYYAYYSGKNR